MIVVLFKTGKIKRKNKAFILPFYWLLPLGNQVLAEEKHF